MAKAKAKKAKKAPAKKAPKKPAPKKQAPNKAKKKAKPKTKAREGKTSTTVKAKRTKPSGPPVTVQNHRFPSGTKVGFLPVFKITVERNLGREPIPKPDKTATVKADGTLEVRGLEKGSWAAAGLVGDTCIYHQFEVK